MTGATGIGRRGALAVLLLPMAAAGARAAANAPSAVIRDLNAALLSIMQAPANTGFAAREAMLRPMIERAYALPVVLRAAVGLRFDSFPADQKVVLLEAFTRFTVASYVANFGGFAGERFEVTDAPGSGQSRVTVASRIVPASGEPTAINYVMQLQPGGAWQITDVLLGGTISRVAVQRSDFRALVLQGDASRLIASLQAKVASLESGQKS